MKKFTTENMFSGCFGIKYKLCIFHKVFLVLSIDIAVGSQVNPFIISGPIPTSTHNNNTASHPGNDRSRYPDAER